MLRLAIQRRLERGVSHPSIASTMLTRAWAELTRVERPLSSHVPVLCVGGATLGGSGRTPLAIACARSLSRTRCVVLVSHAYRARPPAAPHVVDANDAVGLVGDEALECARALRDTTARVVVARSRQRAIDSVDADVIVLDGPLQLTPRRATLSLLAVSAEEPWGSGACPPVGDLRASKTALVHATDRVVVIGKDVAIRSRGAWTATHELLSFSNLRTLRTGVATGIARPERVLAFLRKRGVEPRLIVYGGNHAPLELKAHPDVDIWLVTGKDRPRTTSTKAVNPARVATLDYHLDLPPDLAELLTSRF